MARLQVVVAAVVVLLGGGLLWLHQHDERVRWEAQSAEQRKKLEAQDKQLEGFRESLMLMNDKYVESVKEYKKRNQVVVDSTRRLAARISALAIQLKLSLPDSAKHLADDVEQVCKAQVDLVVEQLRSCERLRQQSDSNYLKLTVIADGFRSSRDGYKKLYEGEKNQRDRGGLWATVGKVGTLGAVLLGVTKLIHLW